MITCLLLNLMLLGGCQPGLLSYKFQAVEDQRLVGSSVECLLVR